MKAVFLHEVSTYFTTMAAYIFGAFLLLFGGIYTMVYNLNYGLANFEYVLSGMSFVFLVIVPVICMRVFAEERHAKTDQLLYSLPLTTLQITLGKYLALLVVFAVPTLVLSIYPLILSAFGSVSLLSAYSAVLGFFLLGAALLSMGMFVSSCTDSIGVAAGLCFVVMLLNYFLASLASFVPSDGLSSFLAIVVLLLLLVCVFWLITKAGFISFIAGIVCIGGAAALYFTGALDFAGLFPSIMENLSLFETFSDFVNGIFSWANVLYYLSIIAVFVFLTVQSFEKRRWS